MGQKTTAVALEIYCNTYRSPGSRATVREPAVYSSVGFFFLLLLHTSTNESAQLNNESCALWSEFDAASDAPVDPDIITGVLGCWLYFISMY